MTNQQGSITSKAQATDYDWDKPHPPLIFVRVTLNGHTLKNAWTEWFNVESGKLEEVDTAEVTNNNSNFWDEARAFVAQHWTNEDLEEHFELLRDDLVADFRQVAEDWARDQFDDLIEK